MPGSGKVQVQCKSPAVIFVFCFQKCFLSFRPEWRIGQGCQRPETTPPGFGPTLRDLMQKRGQPKPNPHPHRTRDASQREKWTSPPLFASASASASAWCVNTPVGNSCFHFSALHHADVMLCFTPSVCTRGKARAEFGPGDPNSFISDEKFDPVAWCRNLSTFSAFFTPRLAALTLAITCWKSHAMSVGKWSQSFPCMSYLLCTKAMRIAKLYTAQWPW